MLIVIAILIVVWASIIRKLAIDHWARVCFRLIVDITIIVILGPIFGVIYALLVLFLGYRAYKKGDHKNV